MSLTLEEKRAKNREAQRKFAKSEKGKKYNKEKIRKWQKLKKANDPDYFKKYSINNFERLKKWKKDNPEKVKEINRNAQRKFASTTKGKNYIREKHKKWIIKKRKEDPDYFKKYSINNFKRLEKWKKDNPEKAKEINRKGAKDFYLRTKKDPKYILLRTLRSRLGGIFKNIKNQKKPKTLQLLGCSIKVLKKHIEAKFKEGMSWKNYGKWHVDHIKPISKFNLIDKEEQKKCFHFSNLQPLWATENLKKGSKF